MPRTTIPLDAWKPQITTWLQHGQSADSIRRNLYKEAGIQISAKTFSRRLREWNIYVKQPYLSNYEGLKRRVREIFEEGQLTDKQAVVLLKREGFAVRGKTYQKLRLEMGLYKRSLEGFRPMGRGSGDGGAVVEGGGEGEGREEG